MTRRLVSACVLAILVFCVGGPAVYGAGAQVILKGVVVGEDDRPVAGAIVKNVGWKATSEPVATDKEGAFSLPADIGGGGWIYAGFYAEGSDGRIGFVSVAQEKPEAVKIVLKPARDLAVVVQDAETRPIAGAQVHFLSDMRRLAGGVTGVDGGLACKVPADTKDWDVFAHKSQAGFDYASSARGRGSLATPNPLPERITLTLDGARTVRLKAIDQDGKPVAGVRVGPWVVRKPDREAEINLSGNSAIWAVTDQTGVATIDWLPERFEGSLSFLNMAAGYYSTENSVYMQQSKPVDKLTINLLPLSKLAGRVTHADGRPAAGAMVNVVGQGTSQNGFHGSTRTDADGRYELEVHTEQAYLVAASLERLATPASGDILVRVGKPAAGVDLVLGPATRVHGRVTVGEGQQPAPTTYLSAVVDKGRIPMELARKEDDRTYYGLRMYFRAQTDASGQYELHLGPGEYRLSGAARAEPVTLKIPATGQPAEIVQDFHMPRAETGPLAGQVVDRDGKPVPGAMVEGEYASSHARRSFRATKCDEQGRFQIERSLDPLVIYARTSDGQLRGVARSEAEAKEARIVIGPLSRATGRLKDQAGKVLAGKQLTYGIRVWLGEPQHSAFYNAFGGGVTTDSNGDFSLPGLVPGEEYSVSVKIDEHSSRNVTQVTAQDAAPVQLGELSVDTNPTKPYVPPTPAERTRAAFAAKPNLPIAERLTSLLAEARREYTRPLLLFGKPADPACIELFRLFEVRDEKEDAEGKKSDYTAPSELRWEFELAALDLERPEIRTFAAERKIDLTAGVPVLAMLDGEGTLTGVQPLALAGGKLDPRLIGAWLAKHKLPTRNAVHMFDAGVAKAKAEDKRVFFILSASWCGPCRMLSRFLAPHKSELEKHFVFVKLDISRDEQADQLQERFKESQRSGVPWFCVLDANGKVLATSNLPKVNPQYGTSNMGFPTLPAEIEHFAGLLRIGAPRLPEEKLTEYKAELLKKK